MHAGEEQYLEGMLDWDGIPNRKYDEYKKIATEFKKIEKYFPYKLNAEVGLAFSFPSQIASAYANYYNIFQDNAASHTLDTLTGGNGSLQSGLGVELLHDSRDNSNYSTKGWFALLDATWNNALFGSGTKYFAFDADIRKFFTLHSGAVLALQSMAKVKKAKSPFHSCLIWEAAI